MPHPLTRGGPPPPPHAIFHPVLFPHRGVSRRVKCFTLSNHCSPPSDHQADIDQWCSQENCRFSCITALKRYWISHGKRQLSSAWRAWFSPPPQMLLCGCVLLRSIRHWIYGFKLRIPSVYFPTCTTLNVVNLFLESGIPSWNVGFLEEGDSLQFAACVIDSTHIVCLPGSWLRFGGVTWNEIRHGGHGSGINSWLVFGMHLQL